MAAHARPLGKRLCENCHKPATVEVFNTRNASMGLRCRACGTALVKALNARP